MCKKSVVDPKYFEAQIDVQIAAMQMPDEYKDKKMVVLCNDCLSKSTVPFHILGGKCKECRSYNTTRTENEALVEEVEEEEVVQEDGAEEWED